jgi:DNA repair protein SbcC/Rad50
LENETGDKETPGSTGETYAAIVLLGIARLSIVQTNDRKGIKFIILEETANLDTTNFSTFPELAEEHGYQIITMTPKPYGSDASREWILHHLIPGLTDTDINFPVSNSYFKTGNDSIPLQQYLNKKIV